MWVTGMSEDNSNEGSGMGSVERGARWIASLDHPFYDDERQRHVWYEASSIGFQLFIQLQLLVAAVTVWIGGDGTAVAYTAGFLGVLGLTSIATLLYTQAKKAEYLPSATDYKSGPVVLYLVLVTAYGLGVVRALRPVDTDPMTLLGFGTGILICVGLGALAGYASNRRRAGRQ